MDGRNAVASKKSAALAPIGLGVSDALRKITGARRGQRRAAGQGRDEYAKQCCFERLIHNLKTTAVTRLFGLIL